MPAAWDDRRRVGPPSGGDDAPDGADAAEQLEHELGLAAALDRSRTSLSPDAQASERMRQTLFRILAEEGVGRPEQAQDATRRSAPTPTPSERTAPLAAPVPDLEPDVPAAAASVGRGAGEHTLSGAGTEAADGGLATARPRRRGRHALPTDHPDNPERTERDRSRPDTGRPGGRRRPSLRRRFGLVVTAVAALAVLAGIATTASRNALPGDALYGVKRATESTGGVFTFGDQAEASRQLDLASTRMDELEGLVAQGRTPDPAAITSAMDDFDAATSSGSRLMLSSDSGGNDARLGDLRTWATAQNNRFEQLRSQIPSANAPQADESIGLLDRVLARTEALRARTGCDESDTSSVDDLGPLPSTGPCAASSPNRGGSDEPGTDGTRSGPGSSGSQPSTGERSGPTTEGVPSGTVGSDSTSSEPSGSRSGTSGSSTSTSPTSTDEARPLLPPITVPPLLPGMPSVPLG